MKTLKAAVAWVASALLLVTLPSAVSSASSLAVREVGTNGFGSDWPTYHQNPLSTGVAAASTDLTPLAAAWTTPTLDGQLYGEPLVEAGRVVIATESDTVYVLAADTGHVLWSNHVGNPVPSGDVVCGDIGPTVGITSTPVIDVARHEVFVVADELDGKSGMSHRLVGLDLSTGRVELNEAVDPPGTNSAAQLQRAALAIADGQVVIGLGSNSGDCGGPYHGFVIAAPEGGGSERAFEVDTGSGRLFGSVWMGGASPVVDAQGNIWVGTGNGSATSTGQPYDRSDSVLELSPALQVLQYFAPASWAADNAADADLGTTAPAFVGNFVFMVGKNRVAYLLDRDHLGGIGGDVASMHLCGTGTGVDYSSAPFGGDAVDGSTVYVPCRDGVTAVAVSQSPRPTMKVLWTVPTGASGPPIIAGGLVWTISQVGTLWGVNPLTGASVVSEPVGGVANHFPTPAVADGLLLVPNGYQVLAFKGPGGLPPPPPVYPGSTSYWVVSSNGAVIAHGAAPALGSVAETHIAAPVVDAARTPDGAGYWLVGADGGVFTFGDARFFGSLGDVRLAEPVVGFAPTFDGEGYWLVGADGGVFAFGDARFFGSLGGVHLVAPVVGMAATPDGGGYWLVGADGGVFVFGDARFFGSLGGVHLVAPVVGMAATPDGGGYWLVGADGGVFAFGDARFFGSLGGVHLVAPVVGMAATPDGGGYWLVGADGGVFAFGDSEVSEAPATSPIPVVSVMS